MSFHDEDSDILMQKRANYIDIPGRSDQFSLIEYLESIMSDRDLERNAEGGRVNKSFGGAILKAIGSGAKGLLDRFNRATDDIELRGFSDYADDTGASFDLFASPKTKKGKKELDDLVKEGIATKQADGEYFISDIDEALQTLPSVKASGMFRDSAEFKTFDDLLKEDPYFKFDPVIDAMRRDKAEGGRVGLQEGGDAAYQAALERLRTAQGALPKDSISVQQKSPGIEALLETYGPELANLLKTPIRPGGLPGVYGSFLPEIAAQDAAQTQAYNLAVQQATGGPGGVAAFQPFLNQAAQAANLQQQAATAGQGAGQQAIQNALNQANLAGLAAIAGQGAGQAGITQAQAIANQMQQAAVAGQQAAQPFLQAAQQFTGPQAFQQFMSPYQEQVIDATRTELQRELDRQQAQLGAQAVQSGAFGGSRFGVAQGELAAQGAQGIASTLANLRQQGFQSAQQAAAQALAQQLGLGSAAQQQAAANLGLFGQGLQGQLAGTQAAQQQAAQNLALFGAAGQQQLGAGSGLMQQAGQNVGLAGQALAGQAGLAQLQPQLAAQNVGLLGQFGQQQQLQQQAIIDAQKQGAKMIAYEPYDRFGFFGGQLTGIMGGYPGGVSFSSQMQQTPNPFQQILGGLGTIAGIGLGAKQAGFFG